ncbi:MAG: hypothetical protein E6L08_14915 [Verrucomicrobia bacterium]|nr:MAG: hypothetical protein E6L08_14915 [Verrucomicrobiota bacterium]
MKLHELVAALQKSLTTFPRFVLPDGNYIPAHAHVTEVGHVVRKFIDCGGMTGREEKALLQTHVGNDRDHRLKSDRFSKILQLGMRVLPSADLDVDVEYDCTPESNTAARPNPVSCARASPNQDSGDLLRDGRSSVLTQPWI